MTAYVVGRQDSLREKRGLHFELAICIPIYSKVCVHMLKFFPSLSLFLSIFILVRESLVYSSGWKEISSYLAGARLALPLFWILLLLLFLLFLFLSLHVPYSLIEATLSVKLLHTKKPFEHDFLTLVPFIMVWKNWSPTTIIIIHFQIPSARISCGLSVKCPALHEPRLFTHA